MIDQVWCQDWGRGPRRRPDRLGNKPNCPTETHCFLILSRPVFISLISYFLALEVLLAFPSSEISNTTPSNPSSLTSLTSKEILLLQIMIDGWQNLFQSLHSNPFVNFRFELFEFLITLNFYFFYFELFKLPGCVLSQAKSLNPLKSRVSVNLNNLCKRGEDKLTYMY